GRAPARPGGCGGCKSLWREARPRACRSNRLRSDPFSLHRLSAIFEMERDRGVDARALKSGERIAVDPDVERKQLAAGIPPGFAQRPAVPSELADLVEPALLGDADIIGDAMAQRIVGERCHELVARAKAFGGALRGVETEAADLPRACAG